MPGAESSESAPAATLVAVELDGLAHAETCFNAWDDNQNGLIDEGCGVHQGQIQVNLAWEDSRADLDLFVTDPKGEVARAHAATELGMALAADCPSDRSECIEQPFENAFLEEDEVPQGKFVVRARLSSWPSNVSSVRARLGIRQPGRTSAYLVEFFQVEQEVLIEFYVASHPKAAKLAKEGQPPQKVSNEKSTP